MKAGRGSAQAIWQQCTGRRAAVGTTRWSTAFFARYMLACSALAWVSIAPVSATAQDGGTCLAPPSFDVEFTPRVGGQEPVTRDSPVFVRYPRDLGAANPSELFVELNKSPVTCAAGDGACCAGAVDPCCEGPDAGCCPDAESACRVAGEPVRYPGQANVLVFEPAAQLDSQRRYQGEVLTLDGAPRQFNFTTSDRVDTGPPQWPNPDVELSAQQQTEECGEARIDVVFNVATDDGPLGSIQYFVFQTAGVELSAPRLVARITAPQGDGKISSSFLIPPEQAEEPVCVSVEVMDGVGNILAAGGESCVDPFADPYFDSLCSASPGAAGDLRGGWWLGAVLGLLWVRRRRACT